MTRAAEDRRGPILAAAVYGALWLTLAIHPLDRPTWLLENALVVMLLLGIHLLRHRVRFSNASLYMMLCFLALHAVGAHYTYSEVPYDAWWRALTGRGLNEIMGWQRNHYDRLIHFAYGLLFVVPIRELLLRVAEVRGFWSYFLPLDIALSTSALYELVEWGAAMLFGGDLGANYLGMQGDMWDSHKDMALAGLGASIAIALSAVRARH